MRKHLILIAVAACLLSAPSLAGPNDSPVSIPSTPTTANPAKAAKASPAGAANAAQKKAELAKIRRYNDAIICRRLAPPTGTRIGGRRICQTRGQWEGMRRDASDAVMREQTLGKMGKLPFKN